MKNTSKLYVQPSELAGKLVKEMEDDKITRGSHVSVRNRYTIYLCREDYERLRVQEEQLLAKLELHLTRHMRSRQYEVLGAIGVKMVPDPDLRPGHFGIYAERESPSGIVRKPRASTGRPGGPAGPGLRGAVPAGTAAARAAAAHAAAARAAGGAVPQPGPASARRESPTASDAEGAWVDPEAALPPYEAAPVWGDEGPMWTSTPDEPEPPTVWPEAVAWSEDTPAEPEVAPASAATAPARAPAPSAPAPSAAPLSPKEADSRRSTRSRAEQVGGATEIISPSDAAEFGLAKQTIVLRANNQEYEFNQGRVIVGRSRDVDFRIENADVSRRHAAFYWSDGEIMVKDLGSTNGTMVNGYPVDTTVVHPGDVILVGDCFITVESR